MYNAQSMYRPFSILSAEQLGTPATAENQSFSAQNPKLHQQTAI